MKKKKEVKYKVFNTEKFRKVEFLIALAIGIIFLIMLGMTICNRVFTPIALVTLAMFLFSICYYYIEDNSKKKLVYVLFGIGVLLIIVEVVYTLRNIL